MNQRESRFQFGHTRWSLVLKAGQKDGKSASAARNELLVRYHEAVYRYLSAKLGDSDAAMELFSRFAERVIELHPFLERADKTKGRFRDYMRAVLSRMVIDYYRERTRAQAKVRELIVGSDNEPAAPEELESAEDEAFSKVWIEELYSHAWKALEDTEKAKKQPFYSMLLYKAQNPAIRSDAIAQHFSKELGRPFTAENVRQIIHRGQEMLNDLLVREVARSLREKDEEVTAERIESELLELQLLDAPRKKALDRYRKKTGEE